MKKRSISEVQREPDMLLLHNLHNKGRTFSGPFVLPGRNPLIFFKGADKITQIIKAVPVGDLGNGIVCSGQLVAGLLDPLMVQIFHWCLMRHLRKETAEIFRGHGYRGGKLLQCKGRGIVVFYELQYLL